MNVEQITFKKTIKYFFLCAFKLNVIKGEAFFLDICRVKCDDFINPYFQFITIVSILINIFAFILCVAT